MTDAAAARSRATYPPLDTLKPVADGVWIVDSAMRADGLTMPIRMTVIRLTGGDLMLHSPTRFSDDLKRALDQLGRIRHLVAPTFAHWVFLREWQDRCPDAATWAAPGLRERRQVRKSGLRLDHDLADAAPSAWAEEIEQAVVRAGLGIAEVAFFHKPTRTLVLTDLVLNVDPQKVPALARPALRLAGVLAPDGMAAPPLRLAIRLRRNDAALALSRLLARHPERVIFAHGSWFDRDGEAALRRSLRWLLP